jgi:hypothetical protein
MLEAAPAPGFVVPGLFGGGRLEIVDDERGIGIAIAARLSALGVDAHTVTQVSADASGVIFARGLLAHDSAEAAIALQRSALGAARTLAPRRGERIFVTLQDTGGDFGASGSAGVRAWSGGLAGLAKTAAAEWPDAAVKAIDVACSDASPDVLADRIVAELLLGGRDVEVALAKDGARAVVRHRAAAYRPVPAGESRVRAGSVLIVSGGARGVTATSLSSLCKHHPRLALLGRTALVDEPADLRAATTDGDLRRALLARATASGAVVAPKDLAREAKMILDCREIRANIAALQRAGAEVSYHAIDVRDADAVRTCVDSIRQAWGPIKGLVHGAGVLADALLGSQTDEQFDRVFATKVDGLRHLLTATASDPLEIVILFSSVAGRLGNSAQGAYAMANEVLSAVAASERVRRGSTCLVRSLAWGPWAGGMVTPGLARLFEKAGVQMIALESGAESLALEVASADDLPQVVLMNGEPPLTALPINGGRVRSEQERFELRVNAATHPYLDGHRISNVPIVPAAMVIEWFFRAAVASYRSFPVRTCRGLKVLRGVPVEQFEGRGVRLFVQTRVLEATADSARLELKLLDENEKPRYAGIVEMGGPPAPAPPSSLLDAVNAPGDAGQGQSSSWSVEQVYSEILFHRGPFMALRSMDRVFDASASGELIGLRALAWSNADWSSDPAIVDGAFQVASVWGRHVLGGRPLPTSVGALHLYRGGPIDSPVRCILHAVRVGKRHVSADLVYVTDSGKPLGYVQELELHLPLTADPKAQQRGGA